VAKESDFVKVALAAAKRVLSSRLAVEQGRSLLYEVVADNKLELGVDPKRPGRGNRHLKLICAFLRKGKISKSLAWFWNLRIK